MRVFCNELIYNDFDIRLNKVIQIFNQKGEDMIKLSKEERELLIETIEFYADLNDLWDLPQDSNGKYYPNDPTAPNEQVPYDEPYMAKEANMLSSIIDRLD